MPKIRSEISHELGREEAIFRLKRACEWGHGVSDLAENWTENVLSFSISIQGVKVSGSVEVLDDSLRFDGKIPLIAVPFKSWLPNILKNAIKERKDTSERLETPFDEPLILYVHIPKAGGTTLGEYIYNQCKTADESDEGLIKNGVFFLADGFFREEKVEVPPLLKQTLRQKHLRAVMGHFSYGLHEFLDRQFTYLTMLRDPVKRVASLHRYLNLEGKMSLEDFVKSPPYREIDNDQTRRIAGVNPAIGGVREGDLENAKVNLRKHFAVVGTVERFDETLVLLRKTLNWTKDVSSFPRNVTGKTSESISDSAIAAIRKRNLFDMELHRFADELMDEKIAHFGVDFDDLLKRQRALNVVEK